MNRHELPRGLRNNNPGNIRKNSDLFQGEVTPGKDRDFKQFKTMAYGYRAMFKILSNYYRKYHLTTIRQIVGGGHRKTKIIRMHTSRLYRIMPVFLPMT